MALPLVGAHHVGNALAAAAVALELGGTPERVAAALGAAAPGVAVADGGHRAAGRRHGDQRRVQRQPGVDARRAGRAGRARRPRPAHAGRCSAGWPSWATAAAAAHAEVAARGRARSASTELVAVGTARLRPGRAGASPACDEAARAAAAPSCEPGDVVLVKASRAAGLERVAAGLLAQAGPRHPRRRAGERRLHRRRRSRSAVSILLTPYLIRFFARQGFGQEIRAEGPQSHQAKRGTPTMGGVAILLAIWLGYLVAHLLTGEPIDARRRCWCCS